MRSTQNEPRAVGLRLLGANVTYWMAAGVGTPFLTTYFRSIGIPSSQIGILMAIGPLATICIQPLWAYLSDKTGRRKQILALLTVAAACAFLLYYAGSTFQHLFFATSVMSIFYYALLPLCDAIVIECAGRYRRDFAKIRMGGTLGYAFVVFIVGFYLEEKPAAQFVFSFLGLLILLVFELLLPVRDEPVRAERRTEKKKTAGPAGEKGIFRTREIVFVLAFVFVGQIGLGFSGSFLGVYAVELGHSQKFVGILSCISALSEVPILLCASRLTKRFGEMNLLAFSCVMMAVRIFLTGIGTVPAMVGAQLLQSVTYMTMYFCTTMYISRNVRTGKASQGQSILALVQTGLAAVAANILGGYVVEWLGTRTSFFAVAGAVLAAGAAVIAAHRVYVYRREK